MYATEFSTNLLDPTSLAVGFLLAGVVMLLALFARFFWGRRPDAKEGPSAEEEVLQLARETPRSMVKVLGQMGLLMRPLEELETLAAEGYGNAKAALMLREQGYTWEGPSAEEEVLQLARETPRSMVKVLGQMGLLMRPLEELETLAAEGYGNAKAALMLRRQGYTWEGP